MKTVKIKKRYYKDLGFMYEDLGLVKDNQVDPSKVLFSKEDIKILKKSTRDLAKKECPYATAKRLDSIVGMHLLNLGPSERAADAIKPGYAIVLD